MRFYATPIQMFTAPNVFVEVPSGQWEITDPNSVTLWFRLDQIDTLGQRRYVPANGSSIQVEFQRADQFRTDGVKLHRLESESQTVTKTASAHADDRSLYSFSLSASDVDGILSGTVRFTLTESGSTTRWVQNYFLKKRITDASF